MRHRQRRNFLATLFLSQGTPMLLGGDEIGRTQRGNNNAYCQDNEVGWIEWRSTPETAALVTFVQRLIALRRAHPSFRRRNFFEGRPVEGDTMKDASWLRPDGGEMTANDWHDGNARCIAMLASGLGLTERGPRGETLFDDDFLLLFNSHSAEVNFTLPEPNDDPWRLLIDTATGVIPPERDGLVNSSPPVWAAPIYPSQARSFVLLSRVRPHP